MNKALGWGLFGALGVAGYLLMKGLGMGRNNDVALMATAILSGPEFQRRFVDHSRDQEGAQKVVRAAVALAEFVLELSVEAENAEHVAKRNDVRKKIEKAKGDLNTVDWGLDAAMQKKGAELIAKLEKTVEILEPPPPTDPKTYSDLFASIFGGREKAAPETPSAPAAGVADKIASPSPGASPGVPAKAPDEDPSTGSDSRGSGPAVENSGSTPDPHGSPEPPAV